MMKLRECNREEILYKYSCRVNNENFEKVCKIGCVTVGIQTGYLVNLIHKRYLHKGCKNKKAYRKFLQN